jgi:hypothetical protein
MINLMGFSLGTEVIRSVIERLQSRGKMDIINRIITMGGVVDVDQFVGLIKKCKIPIHWTNVICKNDNILSHLLRVCEP